MHESSVWNLIYSERLVHFLWKTQTFCYRLVVLVSYHKQAAMKLDDSFLLAVCYFICMEKVSSPKIARFSLDICKSVHEMLIFHAIMWIIIMFQELVFQKVSCLTLKKLSFEGVLWKRRSSKFRKMHRKGPVPKPLFIKKETLAQTFSCKFCGTFKNTFIYRTPPLAASGLIHISPMFPLHTLRECK